MEKKPRQTRRRHSPQDKADECCYWLELLQESRIADTQQTQSLLKEANQITAIMVAGLKIARKGKI